MPRYVGWEWETTGWWVKPTNAREVMTMIGSIGVYSTNQRFAWRGMASADHTLTSSLQRATGESEAEVRRAEKETLAEARDWGLGVHSTGHVDDLQLLSDLQHYGIATRLIDVSSNPMTALWFSCQEPSDPRVGKAGLLLAVNITGWPRMSTLAAAGGGMTWGELEDPHGSRLDQALSNPQPFVVESANPNDRMRAQEGFFLAGRVPVPDRRPFGSGGGYMEFVSPFKSLQIDGGHGAAGALRARLMEPRSVGAPRSLPFVAMIIPSHVKRQLLKYLRGSYNRSARVLFPDYAGYRQYGQHATRRPDPSVLPEIEDAGATAGASAAAPGADPAEGTGDL